MGKRGYPPNFVKPKIALVIFRLYDNYAFNAAGLNLCVEAGIITEEQALNNLILLFSKEAERLSIGQKKIAQLKRGPKPKTDTILRLATKEKWTSSGRPFKQLESYLMPPPFGGKISVPAGTIALTPITLDAIKNIYRDRDKHALNVVVGEYVSRRLNYWNLRLRREL